MRVLGLTLTTPQEYLYRKSLEGKERATYERKRQLKKALEGGFTAGGSSVGSVGSYI
jgi:hypothetical protein